MAFTSSAASVILATPSSESTSTFHRAAGATSFMNSASGGMRGESMCYCQTGMSKSKGGSQACTMYDRELYGISKIKESCPHLTVGGSARRPMGVVSRRLDFKEKYGAKCLLYNEDSDKINGPTLRGSLDLRGYHVTVGGRK